MAKLPVCVALSGALLAGCVIEAGTDQQRHIDGVWVGGLSLGGTQRPLMALALGGEVVAVTGDRRVALRGTYGLSATAFTGRWTIYDAPGALAEVPVEGQWRIESHLAGALGNVGRFDLDYSGESRNEMSFGQIRGLWSFQSGSGFAVTLDVEPDGSFSGTDSFGCVYTGRLLIPAQRERNVYDVGYEAANCGLGEAAFRGLATRLEDVADAPVLWVVAASGQDFHAYPLARP